MEPLYSFSKFLVPSPFRIQELQNNFLSPKRAPSHSGPSRSGCSGPLPDELWISARRQVRQPPWNTAAKSDHALVQKEFLLSGKNFPCLFLSFSCVPMRRTWLCLLCTLPSGSFVNGDTQLVIKQTVILISLPSIEFTAVLLRCSNRLPFISVSNTVRSS